MEEGYSMSSPFVDAFRTSHENATKEFDQFYGYLTNIMTPRRSQNNTIYKATSRTTKRIRQTMDTSPYRKMNMKSPSGRYDRHTHDSDYSDMVPWKDNTPHRSTHSSGIVYSTPSATLCASTPSVILQDHLQEESRRLDQLQHDVLFIQQQSLALSRFTLPPSRSYTEKYTPSPRTAKPIFTTSTPVGSPSATFEEHPLFTPSHRVTPTPIRSPLPLPNIIHRHQEIETMEPIRSHSPIRSPLPSPNITHRHQEIETMELPRINNESNDISYSNTSQNRGQVEMDEDWMKSVDDLPHGKTLDQELGMAWDKLQAAQEQEQRQQIEAKKFSLRPSGSPLFSEDNDNQQHRTIDGDRWTFAGQHYMVHEKTGTD